MLGVKPQLQIDDIYRNRPFLGTAHFDQRDICQDHAPLGPR